MFPLCLSWVCSGVLELTKTCFGSSLNIYCVIFQNLRRKSTWNNFKSGMTDDLVQSQQKLMVEFISVCEQWFKLNNGTVRLRNNAVPRAPYVNYKMLLLTWKKDCLLEKSRCKGGTFHRVSICRRIYLYSFPFQYDRLCTVQTWRQTMSNGKWNWIWHCWV